MIQSAAPVSYCDYAAFVNPQWTRLLSVLGLKVTYDRCSGAELITSDGRSIVDFLSGYCVHNAGHNHPEIIAAVKDELDRCGPAMLQGHVPELAGELAARLCEPAGGRLTKFFLQFRQQRRGSGHQIRAREDRTYRAAVQRRRFSWTDLRGLVADGRSILARQLRPDAPDMHAIPFGDIAALEAQLETRQFAAFFLEPVQSEGGIRVATREYMQAAEALCRKTRNPARVGRMQTGMYRTGPFLAAHHYGVEPEWWCWPRPSAGD
jgi:ornithine--oxo-acid transaminase